MGILIAIWALAALKLILAVILLSYQLRKGILGPVAGAKLAGVYIVTAVAVAFLLNYACGHLPESLPDMGPNYRPLEMNILPVLAVLWTPLVRILGAQMALSGNRHR